MNPFTMCMKCHKMTLITQIKYFHGKMVCPTCYSLIMKEDFEKRKNPKGAK